MRIDLFCKVIDNFGDAGVCLRLCRELSLTGAGVRLLCDDLKTMTAIADPSDFADPNLSMQGLPDPGLYAPAPMVIAAFSCRLNDGIIKKLEERHSVLINLEYLTAEDFASDFHLKPSPLYRFPCYFFFPGFTQDSGGLNFEQGFKQKVLRSSQALLPKDGESFKVSWFSYEHLKIIRFFELFKRCPFPFEITVFEGFPLKTLNKLYGIELNPGDSFNDANLCFKARAMVSQPQYDEILLQSNLNLVRGEDSIIRALLCGRPFLWHIYPQDEDAHILKLKAFLKVFLSLSSPKDDKEAQAVEQFAKLCLAYNQDLNSDRDFDLQSLYSGWSSVCRRAALTLLERPSLSENLMMLYRNLEQKGLIC